MCVTEVRVLWVAMETDAHSEGELSADGLKWMYWETWKFGELRIM